MLLIEFKNINVPLILGIRHLNQDYPLHGGRMNHYVPLTMHNKMKRTPKNKERVRAKRPQVEHRHAVEFVRIAAEILPPDTFKDIMGMVKRNDRTE